MNRLCFLCIVTLLGCVPINRIASDHTEPKLFHEIDITSKPVEKHKKIPESVANSIKPSIKDWLQFYNLNISDFYYISQNEEEEIIIYPSSVEIDYSDSIYNEERSPYKRDFEPKIHDVYLPRLYDYSPSKQKYLNLLETSGVFQKNGKYYFGGTDDCQEIYLTDRKKKTTIMVEWLGSQVFAEAAFWLDENNFIVVGRKDDNVYFIRTFGDNGRDYEFKATTPFPDRTYLEKNIESRAVIELTASLAEIFYASQE